MAFSSKFIEQTTKIDFHENWKNQQGKFFKKHLFLSSFPRSGNGWLRVVIVALILQAKGINTERFKTITKYTDSGLKYACLQCENLNYSIEDICPDIYHHPNLYSEQVTKDVKDLNLGFKLIKTHHIIDCSSTKAIFLFRQPLPCLTSASLLLNNKKLQDNPLEINETITYLAKFYEQMLEHYREQKNKHPENCLFVALETISDKHQVSGLARIMEFLDMPLDNSLIEYTIKAFPLKSGYDKKISSFINDNTRIIVEELLQNKYEIALEISNSDLKN